MRTNEFLVVAKEEDLRGGKALTALRGQCVKDSAGALT